MPRWQLFFKNIQQDLKLYLYMLMLFCLFRIGFIAVLQEYINGATTWQEIMTALYYGMRISLKSSGVIVLLTFLFCTIPNILFVNFNANRIRFYMGTVYISILSVVFNASIPFYQEFHVVFNEFIFNTFKDDVVALGYTLVQQYNLIGRLLVSLLLAILFSWGLKKVLSTRTYSLPRFSRWYINFSLRIGILLTIALFAIFSRFGGSLSYDYSISWENFAISRDEFLNEAILDDVQALTRAYNLHSRSQRGNGLHVEAGKIAEYAERLAGKKLDSHNLNDFLKKEAQGARIEKPRHIFIILGESYANWPLLDKYSELNVANGLKGLIKEENAVYVPAFLPNNGSGTMESMNGLITGLADVLLAPNYQPAAYKAPYSTAIAPQMKRLGYKTNLWYGGFSSWQRMKEFALAQGFDGFYAANDLPTQTGNAWGAEDKILFHGISEMLKDDEPSVNVVLTTSNHPPYTVNVEQDGFDPSRTIGGLPDSRRTDKNLVNQLGHFWYADKFITEFIQRMYKQYPDSIFIVTGDHAARFNLDANPSLYERYAIPFVLYGKGIHPQIFPPNVAGGQLNIIPTLMELIAPKGFEYYSIAESMTKPTRLGLHREIWITPDHIGQHTFSKVENVPWSTTLEVQPDTNNIRQDIAAMQGVSWWMVKHGNMIVE